MPAEGWNGRLQMFGNGGYSSSMPFDRVSQAAAEGYAVAVTDTGHQGSDPDFARDRPEAIDDWAYRAVHETINQAKAAVGTYYGRSADYSYFDGCSTGGQQALSQAQRYPEFRRHHRRRAGSQPHAPERGLPVAVSEQPRTRRR